MPKDARQMTNGELLSELCRAVAANREDQLDDSVGSMYSIAVARIVELREEILNRMSH